MNAKQFHRYVSIFLVSLFVLTGCGNGNSSSSTPTTENNQSAEENLSTGGTTSSSTSTATPSSTSTPTIQKTTISGYVVDDPIQNANISIFSTDGKLIKDNIKSNVNGHFKVELNNAPSEYIVYSNGGEINGTAFDGEMFAYCQSSKCNVTPYSTLLKSLSSQYKGSLNDNINKVQIYYI